MISIIKKLLEKIENDPFVLDRIDEYRKTHPATLRIKKWKEGLKDE